MQNENNSFPKRFLKKIFKIFMVFSLLFTLFVGFIFVKTYPAIPQFLQASSLIKATFLGGSNSHDLIEGATRGMVDSLDDPYSVYMNPEEFQELTSHIQGVFGGVGIYVGADEDGKLTVIAPIEGTPSYEAGIQKGDIIVKIDGESTSKMSLDDAVKVMKGEPGSEVILTVSRPSENGKNYDYSLIREVIDIPTVNALMPTEENNIAYIEITMFASNTDRAFHNELEKLKDLDYKGLIIDLRNNPGGDLDAVANIVGELIPEGPIVHIVDKKGRMQSYDATGEGYQKPLVVLIDEGSASASEVMAGALKDTETAILIGKKSYGKGIVQTVFPLSGNAGIKLTTAKYLTPLKHDIHKKGIMPDIEVDLPEWKEGMGTLPDTQLQKALEYIENIQE